MKQINIKGFTHYYISEDGNVFNSINCRRVKLSKNNYKQLKSWPNKNTGYHTVVLRSINYKTKALYVHRLVAGAYIPNPKNKPQVNHIDGDKSNNHVSNLEWVTQKENMKHAKDIGLINDENLSKKYYNIINNQKLLNKGLEHYKYHSDISYLKKLWSLKSNYVIDRIFKELGLPLIKDRKYRCLPPYVEDIIKTYIKGVLTKKHKKIMNAPDYIEYIKKTYNVKFSFFVYRKIQLDVKKELNIK